ncbi:unnamed protein product [Leuciscus chuanchicus]
MSKRFSAAETLDILLESSGEEGDLPDCGLESSNYEGSETDSQTEFDQDYEDTDGEDSEEQDPGEVTYASKNGEIVWTATAPTQTPGRAPAEQVMKMTPGPTRFACSRVDNISTGEERKPDVILDYNKTKGGVDSLDQMVAAYTCKRKSNRWPMVVFSNMLDVSALNAFVLWSEINPAWNAGKNFRRRIFLEELGKALVSPQIQRRKSVPRGAASLRMLNQIRQPSSENIPGTSTATPPTKRKRLHKASVKRAGGR